MKNLLFLLFICISLLACKKEATVITPSTVTPVGCATENIPTGHVYKENDRTYLWASADSSKHFDITGWSLDVCNLNDYGFEREGIKALREPTYIPAVDKADFYPENEKVIVVKGSNVTKIYPYQVISFHEVVNDTVDGAPIMIAYCILADLAAVYTRIYCGQEFTFAVSGYTYSEESTWDGVDGFILWDRETESLWWPLIDVGVSGLMKEQRLRKHVADDWEYSTWGETLVQYPEALVLEVGQSDVAPLSWPRLGCEDLSCCN